MFIVWLISSEYLDGVRLNENVALVGFEKNNGLNPLKYLESATYGWFVSV
jgi:hypothetical protein